MNILSNLWIKVPQSVASAVASAVVGRAMLLLVDFIGCDTKPHHLSTTITHDPGIKWVKSRQRASNKPKSVKGTGQPRIKKSRKLKQKSSGRRVEEGLKKTHYDEDGTLENQLMLVPEFNKAVHSVPQFAVNISVTRYSDKTQIISGKNYELKKASVIYRRRKIQRRYETMAEKNLRLVQSPKIFTTFVMNYFVMKYCMKSFLAAWNMIKKMKNFLQKSPKNKL